MRFAVFATYLSLIAAPVLSYEIEASRTYPGTSGAVLRVISTADIEVFEPLILAFQAANPAQEVVYDVASSAQLMQALFMDGAQYDLAISSAMDLQIKLANDGFAQPYISDATAALPGWAVWHDEVFAFAREPAVIVISNLHFGPLPQPENRTELIQLLRTHPDRFRGRIATYDVRSSGLGYLFATQDSRNTETFWQLTEIMGRLDAQLYCCSGEMISDVVSGKLALAYNVLGSYAAARAQEEPSITIIEMDDYVSVMLRTALIPTTAQHPETAGVFIDFLLHSRGQAILAEVGLPPVLPAGNTPGPALRPIRLGPGLLVFLDHLRRENFLRSWAGSIIQN
ncbi:MAG: ABC transporter substrate-binding protein [Rhodobacteraceae bacterium]|nr:ABC transporter substrate-binding protein [Paracoccaceae bacterium]